MLALSTKIGSLTLKNPIMPGSGCFSEDMAKVYDIELLGAHVGKTFTREKRDGNATPRVCEVQGSMLNAIGIPSPGIDGFLSEILPFYADYETPFVVSISAGSVDEFGRLCEEISVPGVAAIEVNISCPNVEEGGKAFAMSPSSTEKVMKVLRAATDLPLWAKLTPNTGETVEVAQAAAASGADALTVCNTLLAMSIDIRTRRPKLGNVTGGLSGPALKPVAVRMVYQCAKAVDIPIIGSGGMSTLEDVVEFLIAGATAVQIGTANFINPEIMLQLVRELADYLEAEGISHVSELVGSVRDEDFAVASKFMEAAS
jgi:dihydroorotate dehydrogenase (NAD+) catalytic subunit